MALSSCPPHVEIGDSDLEGWEVRGSGGFGQIYKARHRKWCCDVAVKLLHYDDGTSSSLLREVKMMSTGSSPYVIHVLGLFKGQLPSSGPSVKLGLVMEFMERGSLSCLQRTLQGPPPWSLAFRLTHQVALGINFLHNLSPPLLHLDLKPSNVLLDSFLNAKLTDFGLARFSHSVTRVSKKGSEEEGGTLSYMPPEAFSISYNPTRASDIYSYGILLWSIVTGKEPYPHALSSIVRLRIPQGDRPSLDEIRYLAAGRAGLVRLIELMQRCWEAKPAQRPTAHECTVVTEELYKMHKPAIIDAVHQVLKKLDQTGAEEITEHIQSIAITQSSVSTRVDAVNFYGNVPTGRPPIQEVAGGWAENQRDKARVKDSSSPQATSLSHVDHPRSTHLKMKPSSVQPIQSLPPSTTTSSRLPQNAATPKSTHPPFKERLSPQYQRQSSIPDNLLCYSPVARKVNMHFCNVTGFQFGDNNTMHIYASDPVERKRHPTAPSTVNVPPPHLGGWRDKSGGLG